MKNENLITLIESDISHADSIQLINELSDVLKSITGSSGRASFDIDEFKSSDNIFVLAYLDNMPVGCGAIRKIDEDTAEIKRVYARKDRIGIGKAIVEFLEQKASSMGYKTTVLETRKINKAAVSFYTKLGYTVVSNYGKYKNRDESICFSKTLL